MSSFLVHLSILLSFGACGYLGFQFCWLLSILTFFSALILEKRVNYLFVAPLIFISSMFLGEQSLVYLTATLYTLIGNKVFMGKPFATVPINIAFSFEVFLYLVPECRNALNESVLSLTSFLIEESNDVGSLGPTFFGVLPLLLVSTYSFFCISTKKTIYRYFVPLFVMIIYTSCILVAYIEIYQISSLVMTNLKFNSGHFHANPALLLSYVPVAIFAGVYAILSIFRKRNGSSETKNNSINRRVITCAVIAISISFVFVRSYQFEAKGNEGTVVFYEKGLFDFEVPNFQRMGVARTGMFGLFKTGLENSGLLKMTLYLY